MKVVLTAVLLFAACSQPVPEPEPPRVAIEGVVDTAGVIPPMPREARGVWVASVGNMDWPSRAGLPVDSQKAELRAILDRVRQLRMNLVILQVRPMGDALYASALEPWSEFLTGTMGQAPEPFYDPLAFAIEEAHLRGLELHAWFNPYRARSTNARSEISPTHIARARPDLVRAYGGHLWMDPGEHDVQQHSLRVIADVVTRYDVDGIHIDDYFYPYREYKAGKLIDFPDQPSWRRYQAAGGTLSRADWRRRNVDEFVRRMNDTIHAIKPHVKFGISPFGIWRPGHPSSVSGLDAYVELYADSRKWLNNGWLDYFVPQLYWAIGAPQQSYAALLDWWIGENRHHRHIWAGNASFRVRPDPRGWPPEEIPQQIAITRVQDGASGNVHFNMTSLLRNHGGVSDAIAGTSYTYEALMPRSTWLDAAPPAAPSIRLNGTTLEISAPAGEPPFLYAVRLKSKAGWHAETIPAHQARYAIMRAPGEMPEIVGVTAVDRHGNESTAVQITLD
jgi:uncharacterized lipoprotein YddW (UPF0748 family)